MARLTELPYDDFLKSHTGTLGYDGPAIPLAAYESSSSPGTFYFIVESVDTPGDIYCTCPGWISSKRVTPYGLPKPKTCKHLTEYKLRHSNNPTSDPILEEPD